MTVPPLFRCARVGAALLSLAWLAGCQTSADRQAELADTGEIRVGLDANFPPFEQVDSITGRPTGFDVELARRVFGRLGYSVTFVVVPLEGIIDGLNAFRYDAVISAYTITPERRERVCFSDAYYETGQVIAVAAGDSLIQGLADLAGRRVGVGLGTTGERLAKRLSEAEVFSYDSIGEAFRALQEGRLDAIINDQTTTALYIRTTGAARQVGALLATERYGAAFRRTDGWLRDRFNAALREFLRSPGYDSLRRQYLVPDLL